MVEGAVLVLCGVLYGSWLQWNVLNSVVLSSEHRRELAMAVWHDRVEASAQDAAKSKELALNMIGTIVREHSIDTISLQKEFISVVLNYENQCRTKDTKGGLEHAVEDVTWFWEQLLQGAGKSERIYRARDLFSCCNDTKCNYGVICAGYVLWLLNDTIMRGEQSNISPLKALDEARNILGIVARGKIERSMADLLMKCHMIYAMAVYQYFLRGTIESIPQKLQGVWSRQPNPCPEQDEMLLRAISEVHFSETNKQIFSKIICLMWEGGIS